MKKLSLSELFSSSFLVTVLVLVVSAVFLATTFMKKEKEMGDMEISRSPIEEPETCDFNHTGSITANQRSAVSESSVIRDEDAGLIEIDFHGGESTIFVSEERDQVSSDIYKKSKLVDEEEDENLFEIDISIGSTKLPRIEVGA